MIRTPPNNPGSMLNHAGRLSQRPPSAPRRRSAVLPQLAASDPHALGLIFSRLDDDARWEAPEQFINSMQVCRTHA